MATVLGLNCTDIISKIKPWDLRLILLVIGSEHNVMTSSNVHRCGNHAFNQSQSQGASNLNVLQFKLNFALHPSDSDLTYLFTCGKSEKDRGKQSLPPPTLPQPCFILTKMSEKVILQPDRLSYELTLPSSGKKKD